MNLQKNGENIKIISQLYDILMLSVLLLLGFPVSCINYLTSTFSTKAFSKKVEHPCIFNETEQSAEDAQGNSFMLFHKHTD